MKHTDLIRQKKDLTWAHSNRTAATEGQGGIASFILKMNSWIYQRCLHNSIHVQYQWKLPERLTAVCAHVPGRQLRLRRVRVKHIDVLMVQQLYELGRFQKLPLAVKHTGGLFGRVNHLPGGQREDHHKRVLRTPQNSWWTPYTETALIEKNSSAKNENSVIIYSNP